MLRGRVSNIIRIPVLCIPAIRRIQTYRCVRVYLRIYFVFSCGREKKEINHVSFKEYMKNTYTHERARARVHIHTQTYTHEDPNNICGPKFVTVRLVICVL